MPHHEQLFDDLLRDLPVGTVTDVRIGAFWTAVVAHVDGEPRCGLAATFRSDRPHSGSGPDVRNAGSLTEGSARELAGLVHAERILERSLGLAALNALLPRLEEQWTDGNAEVILAERGAGKRIAMVGHFPFAERLRDKVGTLWVLELNPQRR